ncbi:MAG: thermonuclease family protein [Bacteroidetes bacterium]|jgi:endonuclease YncB( thermonuclease family)|nr:thermonuclease family protein [Bacteroidota bacterium]HQW45905.1 thermonuclease family protein [Chitinophagaceae bacterium]MBK6818123.1 thermonuclease family protein [Bacteroidota bacterium]MBK7040664.1 thermonuclease family protein [Bacteroidota bacterium]MBK8328475.1 thermonuclease family protein [Bacteroidota bacterium]
MRSVFSIWLLLSVYSSFAQTTLIGRAIRILDGDTFEILVNDRATYKVRLTDIDAPEKKQDFGNVAKQQLAQFIFGKEVKVVYDKLDRNKRILGHVYFQNQYINLQMVSIGMAWHFKKYSKDAQFALAENKARKQKLGLWIQPNPIAPWDYRGKRPKK